MAYVVLGRHGGLHGSACDSMPSHVRRFDEPTEIAGRAFVSCCDLSVDVVKRLDLERWSVGKLVDLRLDERGAP